MHLDEAEKVVEYLKLLDGLIKDNETSWYLDGIIPLVCDDTITGYFVYEDDFWKYVRLPEDQQGVVRKKINAAAVIREYVD